jgi:hypothetical protein
LSWVLSATCGHVAGVEHSGRSLKDRQVVVALRLSSALDAPGARPASFDR